MKIQCNVCEKEEATVLCCADEAALCAPCDQTVHAANKLASKHQRVSLSNSTSTLPICDICQDAAGYFFCLEDRALLCRKCDISIHSANSLVSTHQRFLLTGVRVGFEPAEPGSSSSGGKTQSEEKVSDADNQPAPKKRAPTVTTPHYDRACSDQNGRAATTQSNKRSAPMSVSDYDNVHPTQNGTLEDVTQYRMNFAGGSVGGDLSQWSMDEFMGIDDFQQNYNFTSHGSSKADSEKLGSSDSSTILRSLEDDLDSDDRLGQVPDISWSMPQSSSPPTSSGIYWPRSCQELVDSTLFVPDISWSQPPTYHHFHHQKHDAAKRRRQL